MMKKKEENQEEENQAPSLPVEQTAQFKELQNQNNLLSEMQNLKNESYFRLQLIQSLVRLEERCESLEKVISDYLNEPEEEDE